ncbi:MAG TPA: sn-glycerol-3-phosphate ABC transporter ATP-binding protein UgpC [Steroidobacteraceae bacterium]|nr:sn-glycerol-3-phosphate ABC transporter ATP-binding protein UgpC [Steroidobacteraceae bacterium]
MAEVTLRSVRKVYPNGHVAIDDASFGIRDGELLVLVGPSGCGKSTLLRLIAGLEEASSGSILIGERDVTRLEPRDRDIAMVFQSYALYPHMTVARNLGFGLELRGHDAAEIEKRVKQAAETLELTQFLDRLPRQLSGGQRQRVALGRALVRHPQVFLLDEPLSNLDAKLRASTRAEIARLHRALGTTMIYVTHDQVEAMTLGQRIVVLDKGVIQQIDAPMQIYERPVNLFVAGFLGNPAMNFFRGQLRDGVLTGSGSQLRLPTVKAQAGQEIVAGVRPEDLHIVESSAAPGGGLTGTVELLESVGSEAFIHATSGGWKLIARSSPYNLPAVGARITLQPAPDRIHFFDAQTGRRLEQ